MTSSTTEISVQGRAVSVPAAWIGGHEVIVSGRWPSIATLRDEEWLPDTQSVHPVELAAQIRSTALRADIFSYSPPLDAPVLSNVRHDMDNVAVIETSDFKGWWDALPQEARKNTRRAAKRGVVIRSVTFDDELAAGIKSIYDEAPVRQGRRFWHFGKDIETVKRENSTYLDRCQFVGAYHGSQLIGFMKWVYVNDTARIMQILCLNSHQDKRPIIALIAKAAEICHQAGKRYLIYGKYTYGGKSESSITEFKRRLGFQQKNFPRYHVPITTAGRIALQLGLHTGWKAMLPARLLNSMLKTRAAWLRRTSPRAAAADSPEA